MSLSLKTGEVPEDPRTDRIEEVDERSRRFPVREILQDFHYTRPRSYTWRVRRPLDQVRDGACVGFAWTHELIGRPREHLGLDAAFARQVIYWEAQKIDRWPGGVYPGADPLVAGTSVLAAAKVVQAAGYIHEYRWAETPEDLVAVLGYRGPCLFGTRWFQDMHVPDAEGFMHPTGRRRSGHCLLATGVKVATTARGALAPDGTVISFLNSWGRDWGLDGFARMRLADLTALWEHADVCVPVGRRRIAAPPPSQGA